MQPLDLAVRPPRGPRVRVAGIVYTARLIDKLRASLPGGDPSGFFPFIGFSEMWAYYTGVDLVEFQQLVLDAASENVLESWLADRTRNVDKSAINARMERFTTDRTPEPMRDLFKTSYPADLRTRFPVLFDLLEADDARLYQVAR
jgi:hypothetical protein